VTEPSVVSSSAPFEHVTPAQITLQVREHMKLTCAVIDNALVGRFVRVTSDHNGQPYGRSRKSWRGQVCRIKAVNIDAREGEIHLVLEGHEYGETLIPGDEVEFT
jgi:hypothetical protein